MQFVILNCRLCQLSTSVSTSQVSRRNKQMLLPYRTGRVWITSKSTADRLLARDGHQESGLTARYSLISELASSCYLQQQQQMYLLAHTICFGTHLVGCSKLHFPSTQQFYCSSNHDHYYNSYDITTTTPFRRWEGSKKLSRCMRVRTCTFQQRAWPENRVLLNCNKDIRDFTF